MWRCECGCVDKVERKYKSRKRGEDGRLTDEEEEKVDVSWRSRQAMPLQSLGKAQAYHVWIICTDCQKLWDNYLTSQPLWRDALALDRKIIRMEIEGRGATMKPEWEEVADSRYALQLQLRDLAREWAEKRKAEVAEANRAAGVEVNVW